MQPHVLRAYFALTICLLAGAALAAQNSQPSFENDQVIINEPHPGIPIPGFTRKMHDHKLNRVMIYLHPGGETLHYQDGSIKELKWAAGEAQWSPASGYHYSVIPDTTPPFTGPMIVDIGLKKPGDPSKVFSTTLDPLRVDPKDFTLQFENSQVRVLRVKLAPGQSAPIHEETLNSFVVYITDQNLRETSADGKSDVLEHKASTFSWNGPCKHSLQNLSDKPFEALIVELKS
jgi:hypothetical protein